MTTEKVNNFKIQSNISTNKNEYDITVKLFYSSSYLNTLIVRNQFNLEISNHDKEEIRLLIHDNAKKFINNYKKEEGKIKSFLNEYKYSSFRKHYYPYESDNNKFCEYNLTVNTIKGEKYDINFIQFYTGDAQFLSCSSKIFISDVISNDIKYKYNGRSYTNLNQMLNNIKNL